MYGGASKVPRAVAVSVIFSNHQVDGGFIRTVFTLLLTFLECSMMVVSDWKEQAVSMILYAH